MSFVKLFGFYSVLLSGIRVSSKMELQVGHPNLFTTLHWPLLNRIFKTFTNDIFDKYVFQIIICFIIWKCAQLLLALAIILKIKKLRSSVSDVKVVLYKLYRVAIGAKTSKTVVLPEFCKTERSGGAPPCYRGLIWLEQARRASSTPALVVMPKLKFKSRMGSIRGVQKGFIEEVSWPSQICNPAKKNLKNSHV